MGVTLQKVHDLSSGYLLAESFFQGRTRKFADDEVRELKLFFHEEPQNGLIQLVRRVGVDLEIGLHNYEALLLLR